MYILATTTKYQKDVKYYTKSGNTYTLFTNYNVGDTITGTKYQAVEYNKLYLRTWGSSETYKEFPYQIDGNNNLPEHDVSQNDVDLDAYTNTKGVTIRNRVRHDVPSLDFNVPTMTGEELHNFFDYTKNENFEAYYFDESNWNFVSKKVYRSGTVKYHRYYMDANDPLKNIYTNIQFSFIEL
ncbi:MAG: hypothetical protein J6W64_08260 [Bacilli bacterium]|nr:hypothetical protein [Bacilli bacterium]